MQAQYFSWLYKRRENYYHRTILSLAIPAMLAQISLPLLGLVDTAVMGHFASTEALAAVATGAGIYMVIANSTGFLRSSTLGLVAQSWGRGDKTALKNWFLRSLLLALLIGIFLTLISVTLLQFLDWKSFDLQFDQGLYEYLIIRAWGLPAYTLNLVCLGMVLGFQDSRAVLRIMLLANLVNMVLDVVFVVGLDMHAEGVAYATLIAEYLAAGYGLYLVMGKFTSRNIALRIVDFQKIIQDLFAFRPLLALNGHFFLRSTTLSLCFAALPIAAAGFGAEFVAANAVVLNLWLMTSYTLDGIANAAEALVGRTIGRGRPKMLKEFLWRLHFWLLPIISVYFVVFAVFFEHFIALQTSDTTIQAMANDLRYWLYLGLFLSPFCVLLDGVYYGAALGKEVSSTMLVAGLAFGLCLFGFRETLGNEAIWLSLNLLFIIRSVGLYLFMPRVMQRANRTRQKQ